MSARENKKYEDLPIENRDKEDAVFHVVSSSNENFGQDVVVGVRNWSNTLVVARLLLTKKLVFRCGYIDDKVWEQVRIYVLKNCDEVLTFLKV